MYEKELSAKLISELAGKNYGVESDNKLLQEGYAGLKEFFDTNKDNLEDELVVDYAKIFLAAGEAKGNAAFPYESVYTSKQKLVMQEAWSEVKALYDQKGIVLSNAGSDIKEDHIASELAFMAYLCENGTVNEALSFLNGHLLNWVEDFVADIEKYARTVFYPAIGKLTVGFLQLEKEYLEGVENTSEEKHDTDKSYQLSTDEMDEVLLSWKKDYKIYAPVLLKQRGSAKDVVRYREINSVKDIYNERNSDFSAKEVYYPVMQTMFFFTETEVIESQLKDDKGILLLLHPCDINAMRRLDNIFLKNGAGPDMYYARLREKVKVILLECKQSADNCFCVSMGSNVADNYELAVRLDDDKVFVQVRGPQWNTYFYKAKTCDFAPRFITENERKVTVPQIPDKETLKYASEMKYWEKFDDKCIGCGGCNTVCPTCSCFDTNDIIYSETSRDGERRRVWSSCMLDTFTLTAGGGRARKTQGANMRFKTLHKIYDYQKRFGEGENMCVGCGRCIMRCSKDIDFSQTLNEFAQELEKKEGM
jgi:anaerobic sulfite reductase subunit A